MIKQTISFDEFKEYDFILYEQYLFRNLLDIYRAEKIKYKLLAINIFKDKNKAPILVDLKSMDSTLIEDFYDRVFLLERTNYINRFDKMPLVQNLIKSKLDLDDFSDELTALMVINKKILFRYYDPRVMLHLYNIRKYKNINVDINRWCLRFLKVHESWSFGLMGGWYFFDNYFEKENISINFGFEEFMIMNAISRKEFNRNDLVENLNLKPSEYLKFEVKYVR